MHVSIGIWLSGISGLDNILGTVLSVIPVPRYKRYQSISIEGNDKNGRGEVTLSARRKIIILTMAVLTALFLVLGIVEEQTRDNYTHYTTLYGFTITKPLPHLLGITFIGRYKYHLIAATILIGIALLIIENQGQRPFFKNK